MEKFYFIVPDAKKVGVPKDLEGAIHDRFIPKEEYMKDGSLPSVLDSSPWRNGWLNTSNMPNKLYLLNLHRKLDFDIYKKNGGFIFSDDFKKIFDAVEHPDYIATPLAVINRDGITNTVKNYWYVVIKEDCEAIDFNKSQLKEVNMPDGRLGRKFPLVLKYGAKLVLDTQLFHPKDFFYIYQPYLSEYLVCNEAIKQKIIGAKLNTIQFVELEHFVQYFNDTHTLIKAFRQMKLIVE